MDEKPLTVCLRYYGISPWEIEVVYNLFNEKFEIIQEEIDQTGVNFVSALTIVIPLTFSEEFFKWFEFRAWEKVKHIIKEMKRRRGNRKAIRVEIIFKNEEWYNIKRDGKNPILSDNDERLPDYPNIKFVIDSSENHNFNSAIEKIDFVVELLPYHLNDNNIPNNLSEAVYKYDIESGKWRLNSVLAGQEKFVLTKKGWSIVT